MTWRIIELLQKVCESDSSPQALRAELRALADDDLLWAQLEEQADIQKRLGEVSTKIQSRLSPPLPPFKPSESDHSAQ